MAKTSDIKSIADDETPMMQQYHQIKKEYSDAILFFRMGDFYEMFNEDAKEASRILEIALTSRNKNRANPTPMCGIPFHSANLYISKLIKNGKKVAICEQTEDAKQAKGLVKREVIRVVTPGTVLDDSLLDPRSNHFIVSIFFGNEDYGLAAVDLSTGIFKVTQFEHNSSDNVLLDELVKLDPKEVLVPESIHNSNGSTPHWIKDQSFLIHSCEDWTYSYNQAYRILTEQFKTKTLEGFGCEDLKSSICAAGSLIQFLQETQKGALQHINTFTTFSVHNYMMLDQATINSLELIRSSDGTKKFSLLNLLDQCCTPMGSRSMREWILKPLIDLSSIDERLNVVEEFINNPILRNDLRNLLKNIFDLERLLGRIALSACSPRDLTTLKSSLLILPKIYSLLENCSSTLIKANISNWDNVENAVESIEKHIVDDPPHNFKDGHLIKPGSNKELDRLKSISREGNTAIANLETKEKERTRIPQLKVGYNKIYGYYIEVTKRNLDRIPEDYIRKQSLVNSERYISPELKKYEQEISGADEKILTLEQQIFQKVREQVSKESSRIQQMSQIIAEIDGLISLAETSHRNQYCRPNLSEDNSLNITNGRHPIVETLDLNQQFIPNDTLLDCSENQIMIITGPNMAGKSTYLRQVALITLMAQIGSFVPADTANIGIVNRIFSRVGAQDHLIKGQSTFMVEMNETANILNNASSKSLLILDEIGRGTSTFDGISLAWSIVEYLHGSVGAKTLFATHYHEMTDLERELSGVKNLNVQVKEWNEEIIFLRKILPGPADKSYGIQVARLAGLPENVLERAREVLSNLENSELDEEGLARIGHKQNDSISSKQIPLFQESPTPPYLKKLKEINPDDLSPREALEKIYELVNLIQKNQKLD